MRALHDMQGVPLSMIQKQKEVAGVKLSDDELNLLLRLAQDGAVNLPASRHLTRVSSFSFLPLRRLAQRSLRPKETSSKKRWQLLLRFGKGNSYLANTPFDPRAPFFIG